MRNKKLIFLFILVAFGLSISLVSFASNIIKSEDVVYENAKELPFLATEGTNIVEKDNPQNIVSLRGYNIGLWLSRSFWGLPIDSKYNSNERYSANNDIEIDYELFMNENNFSAEEVIALDNTFFENYITEADVIKIAETGSNVVRIPFGYTFFLKPVWDPTKEEPLTYVSDKEFKLQRLTLLENKIEMFESYGIYTILDMHVGPGNFNTGGYREAAGFFSGDTAEENQEIALKLWADIAYRFKDNPAVAGYDLVNEAEGSLFESCVVPYYRKAYDRIRKYDKNHIIIMEVWYHSFDNWGSWDINDKTGERTNPEMPIPANEGWKNVVYSTHDYFYDGYTLEKYAELSESKKKDECHALLSRIAENTQISLDDMQKYGVPLYVAEFNHLDSEEIWKDALKIYNDKNISYTMWTYKAGWESYEGLVYFGRTGIVGYKKNENSKGKLDLKTSSYDKIMELFSSKSDDVMNYNNRNHEMMMKYIPSIEIKNKNLEVEKDGFKQINAEVKGNAFLIGDTLEYRSNNENIVKVDKNGKIQGVAVGETEVVIVGPNGIEEIVRVECVNKIEKIKFDDKILYNKVLEELEKQNIKYTKYAQMQITVKNIGKVEELNLSSVGQEEKIQSLVGLNSFTALKTLDLSGNEIKNETIVNVADLKELKTLNLGSNQIGPTIPGEFINFKKLEVLYLSNNNIEVLSETSALTKLTSLKVLTLSNNNVAGKPKGIRDISALGYLKNLQILKIANNNLNDVSVLNGLTKLKTLDTTGNNLSK